ncbi:hypothetical protein J2X69_004886 [Algoriphagus sp. 4150]|uniref:hypothetical protein n=1 Tax=Algoriphagus sp. 4150 TaxID=2817756 RepID=UPI0028558C2C|nr:hypothetical protein [Algoriphagus sp. 4150]MDR7132514.1 hypothetical protein [Algoriphagus sp. 4150]
MKRLLSFISILIIFLSTSCEREIEEGQPDLGFDFQPLEVGLFWIYEVDQTIYFGENDSEEEHFYYRDHISSYYTNEEGEQVFVVLRTKSQDRINWTIELPYTLIQRDFSLVRTIENQAIVALVFPPKSGIVWNGNVYRNVERDDFEMLNSGTSVQVNQENIDDLITYRDIRYEVYEKGVGMVEKYAEVLTYCSRNDCLGDMLINSGYKISLKMSDYGSI